MAKHQPSSLNTLLICISNCTIKIIQCHQHRSPSSYQGCTPLPPKNHDH